MLKKIAKKHLQIIFFAIFIIILISFLANYLFSTVNPTKKPTTNFQIIDIHEHIQSIKQAPIMLKAMNEADVINTVLVGTPIETLTSTGSPDFTRYDENNAEILKIVKTYPNKFYAFCTIDPRDEKKLMKLKNCLSEGGRGLKLYTGHGNFYDIFKIALDDPKMDEIYAFCEQNKIPIIWHVNGGKYLPEFERVLGKYPNLIVDAPHFILLSSQIEELSRMLDTYPNLYTDISFGSIQFMVEGFQRISLDALKFQEFFKKYSNRIMFGTDEVLIDSEFKTDDYMIDRIWCYRDLLEQENFSCAMIDQYEMSNNLPPIEFNGLKLDKEALEAVYSGTARKFLKLGIVYPVK